MARICLECATPKPMGTGHCAICKTDTITWDGEPRRSICEGCTNFNESIKKCRVTDKMDLNLLGRATARAFEAGALHYTKFSRDCEDFKADPRKSQDSPHPMSKHDIAEAKMWLEGPSAFWLDPRRWDHVTNPYEQACIPPDKESVVSTIAFAGLALIAGAFSKKTG